MFLSTARSSRSITDIEVCATAYAFGVQRTARPTHCIAYEIVTSSRARHSVRASGSLPRLWRRDHRVGHMQPGHS